MFLAETVATLTIYGNGHSISSTGAGITVENGQTLNSHKVSGWSSSGLSSALIENNGTTALKILYMKIIQMLL